MKPAGTPADQRRALLALAEKTKDKKLAAEARKLAAKIGDEG